MMANSNITKLKGGSLSGTFLHESEGKAFIRKKVSLTENREFGFYRWFSQAKKLQSLQKMFPELFPKMIEMGAENGEAFFDLEYIKNSITGFDFLIQNPSNNDIKQFFDALVIAMDKLHNYKINSFKKGIDLYIDQEVRAALDFCKDEPQFDEFLKYRTIIFNGQEVPSIINRIDEFYALAHKHYTSPQECLTHGNITLENILYIKNENKIIFIDVYQENFIDNIYNEYSQILQSSNSKYEISCQDDFQVSTIKNSVTSVLPQTPGLDYFNQLFQDFLKTRLDQDGQIMTKLYEVSQFTRMLPFKKTVAKEKMIYLYSLASYLFNQITK